MQDGAAGPVDGAGVGAIQRHDVVLLGRRIVRIEVREAFPAAADAYNLAAVFRAPVNHFFDDGIQPGNVAAAGENANTVSHVLLCRIPG